MTFLLPFPFIAISSICCEWEEFLKLALTFLELLQPISLCLLFVAKPLRKMSVPVIKIPWFSSRFSPHESNASLAPSRLSVNRDEPLQSWQDVVTCAKNSVCYENDISTAPEPYTNRDEVIYELPRAIDSSRRHTIRHVMMRAKHNNLSNIEEIMSPPKVIVPPLPKNIPPEILDDVKLFDFYYKNLDSIFITDSNESVTTRSSILSDDVEKRSSSGNRISRMLSFGQQQTTKKKLMSIDEGAINTANDQVECAK